MGVVRYFVSHARDEYGRLEPYPSGTFVQYFQTIHILSDIHELGGVHNPSKTFRLEELSLFHCDSSLLYGPNHTHLATLNDWLVKLRLLHALPDLQSY